MTDAQGHSIDIPVASVIKDVKVNVKLTGFRRWHMRLRIGLVLMRLAIWISGMGCNVEEPPDEPDATHDESFGSDEHLTERGKESIGTLRQMRAKGYPRSRIQRFLDHDIGRCHASHD